MGGAAGRPVVLDRVHQGRAGDRRRGRDGHRTKEGAAATVKKVLETAGAPLPEGRRDRREGGEDRPFALPTIVASIVLLSLYGPNSPIGVELNATRWGLVVALLFVTLPFVIRSVQPVLIEADREVEEAAASLGLRGKPLLDAESLALRGLALALCGEALHADAAGSAALEASREEFTPTVRADTICTLARTWTLDERWSASYVEALRQTYELMFHWGDEPRRARVGAMLARFLVEAGQLDDAEAILLDCHAGRAAA